MPPSLLSRSRSRISASLGISSRSSASSECANANSERGETPECGLFETAGSVTPSRVGRKQPEQPSERWPQLLAGDDRVEMTEPEVRLGEAEVVRKLLARRLRNHPRTCE